jgi:hypothetical protein
VEKREKFASRLGFILISAGCSIGLGDVWRFPYITGQYGGGIFVLIYLIFIFALGLPIMTMEFAVGRASQKSIATSFKEMQREGQKWHWMGYAGIAGNYILMMFYTSIAGWMLAYFYKFLIGQFNGLNAEQVGQVFDNLIANPVEMTIWLVITTVFCFGVCSLGLQEGVEKINKGNKVLFIGLPCEVAAMKRFISSDNLYTCELICHGPTSIEIFNRYISFLENNKGSRVISYTCRHKNPHWKPICSKVIYEDGTEQVEIFSDTGLGKAFQMVKRHSCYRCEYKNDVTVADLTIGDFHAVSGKKGYNVDGVSICLINTIKGLNLIKIFADDKVFASIANHDAAYANRALVESLPKLPGRQRFIRIMKYRGIDAACKDKVISIVLKYRRYPYRLRLWLRRCIHKLSVRLRKI